MEEIIHLVWEKAQVWSENSEFAMDACGAIIKKEDFQKQTPFGWDIDFVKPLSKKGKKLLINMRPMHWKNLLYKANDYPTYTAKVVANGKSNIEITRKFTVCKELQEKLKNL